jgi:hypothetical protein
MKTEHIFCFTYPRGPEAVASFCAGRSRPSWYHSQGDITIDEQEEQWLGYHRSPGHLETSHEIAHHGNATLFQIMVGIARAYSTV